MIRSLIVCFVLLLVPNTAAAQVGFYSMTSGQQRRYLRQAHQQTQLTAGADYTGSDLGIVQHLLDRAQVPTARGRIVLHSDTNPADATANTQWSDVPGTPVDMTFKNAGYGNAAREKEILYHELGHAFARDNMTDAQRQKVTDYLHKPGLTWDGPHDPGAEQFADIYSILAQHAEALKSRKSWRHLMASDPSTGDYTDKMPSYYQLRKIAQTLRDASVPQDTTLKAAQARVKRRTRSATYQRPV